MNEEDWTGLFILGSILLIFCSWTTHVVNTIQNHDWILLIVGIIVPPIGWVHGVAIWLGMFS